MISRSARQFLSGLDARFAGRHRQLLADRADRIGRIRQDRSLLQLREDTRWIRDDPHWRGAAAPEALRVRQVELTGPADQLRMVRRALASGADQYMADLEDSMCPGRRQVDEAHQNLRTVIHGEEVAASDTTLWMRPRGLHLQQPFEAGRMPAFLYDVGLHCWYNAERLATLGCGPYLYIPKLHFYEEGLYVRSVVDHIVEELDLPADTVRLTPLIETLPAAFEAEELAHALAPYLAGLNVGRWDYLHSLQSLCPEHPLPDRSALTMDAPFLQAYEDRVLDVCRRRGVSALGGMAAHIPVGGQVPDEVLQDKRREAERGFDGAWVAHPDLVEPVRQIFASRSLAPDEYNPPDDTIAALLQLPEGGLSDAGLAENVQVAVQYTQAWLEGRGAVAIDGKMEDVATAEIALAQLRQSAETLRQADALLEPAPAPVARVLRRRLADPDLSLTEACEAEVRDRGFVPLQYTEDELSRLAGSRPVPPEGAALTRHRGNFLNEFLQVPGAYYKFLGTSTGVSAVQVVAGGGGRVGPYAGGWQTNAMKNRLQELLPDTLHCAPEEAGACAAELNRHLHKADLVQGGGEAVDYYGTALLADLEQGWGTPEKTRMAVHRCIDNGVNVIHIEDQGERKRCGHLGDKELATFEDYCLILRAANLAAQERLPGQAGQQWVRFVARTDALSAKRITNSALLRDAEHPEHRFVDWERGTSPDGKYLYLRDGVGLELSIQRCAEVVRLGLASHVWMETPTADLHVARRFLHGVNEALAPHGVTARGLYNHSPSFDWDIKFVEEARPLAEALVRAGGPHSSVLQLQENLVQHGDPVQGDQEFQVAALSDMALLVRLLNRRQPEVSLWLAAARPSQLVHTLRQRPGEEHAAAKDELQNLIVQQRLRMFEPMLASFGFDLHLVTLPEFHVLAHQMHQLSAGFDKHGIEAYVSQVQRPERLTWEADPTYTYYKHQSATGTGVEAAFGELCGSSDVHGLSDSTETDDLNKRHS
jgi:malate synthase